MVVGVNVGKNLGRKSRFKKVSFQVLPEGCDRWTGSPKCGCKRVISASCLSKPVLPIEYRSLWSIWAKDLLRHVRALC